MQNNLRTKTIAGFMWSFFERIGAHLVSFIVSIVLARLLLPEEYGIIAIVLVFINICNVFVNNSFAVSLVQKKDADEIDFSSVFYFNIIFSILLYILLYFCAPYIANFYDMPILVSVIRVLSVCIIFSAANSVQKAQVSRSMQFKKFFFSTLVGTIISAVIGIGMAYIGYGIWALVAQYLMNAIVNTIVLFITVKWIPKRVFSVKKLKVLFNYGWKILVSGLISVFYEEFRSLYIGKLYSANDLAFYTRGKQFPHLIVDNVNSSIAGVFFPLISKKQDNIADAKAIMKRTIKTSTYILTPLLIGLAAVAEPLVILFLTEKWLPCVPFLRVICINSALMPLLTANLQAINALGRSDIALKMEFAEKSCGILMILLFARINVIAIAWVGVLMSIIAFIIYTSQNKKLLNYGILEQLKDVCPTWAISFVMMIITMSITLLNFSIIVEFIMMILVGILTYILLSLIFKNESFMYIFNIIKPIFKQISKKK